MDNRELMVTIRCLAYNHEPYIRQCLDGFVMQKTNFRFEAIVHDDSSTDGTAAIIKEYAEKYPDIVKPIFETENQYSKRDGSINRIMNEYTHGKYVAMCEGDDYWIDPLKLQKQVDFLEANPNSSFITHGAFLQNSETGRMIGKVCPSKIIRSYSIEDAILGYGHKICTNTFMFRKEVLSKMVYLTTTPCMDYPLPIIASLIGQITNLPYMMAVHRVLSKSSITKSWKEDFNKRIMYNNKYEEMLEQINSLTKYKYTTLVNKERTALWVRSYLANNNCEKLKEEPYKSYIKSLSIKSRMRCYLKIYMPNFTRFLKLLFLR